MNTLSITLPTAAARDGAEYDFVLGDTAMEATAHGRCAASLLPSPALPAAEIVAVIPPQALCWIPVHLPEALARTLLRRNPDPHRLRAMLAGLLEEQLLDEPEQIHFAIFPGATADAPVWVAICNRHWLHGQLQALEQAGRPVTRIVPEFAPLAPGSAPRVCLSSAQEGAQLVLSQTTGVAALPWCSAAIRLAREAEEFALYAEPALAQTAEQALDQTPTLQTDVQRRLLATAQSDWNLAQFEFAASRRTRLRKSVHQAWQDLTQQPAWRPARWSLLALALIQVLGLNALAWQQRAAIEATQTEIRQTLLQTFSHVSLVIDAPRQMQRELALLQQATGQSGRQGLTEALTQLARFAPAGSSLDAIELEAGVLQVRPASLGDAEFDTLAAALRAQGWRVHREQQRLLLSPEGDS